MAHGDKKDGKTLWGGSTMHPALAALSVNLADDLPLAPHDLIASAAYARALGRCGVLNKADATRLSETLLAMRGDYDAGRFVPDASAEDIHTAIEMEVTRRLGDLGGRLHTGRSRNDQVATALRLAAMQCIDDVRADLRDLVAALHAHGKNEIDTLMPGTTHLQHGQPIRLAHWLLSHAWPLCRDDGRLADARGRTAKLPLGSGALSGHAFGLDRNTLAAELGFVAPTENSLDAVGDRDFVAEILFAQAMLATHLSRLAEELVLFSTTEYGFVGWPDSLATGSSLMPNKKNPDLAELVRGKTGAAIGEVVTLLATLKGLPGSYQRDLQETKAPLWRATASLRLSIRAMTAAVDGVTFIKPRLHAALSDDLLATEAADALVAEGVPFRQAHHAVAAAVRAARKLEVPLRGLAQHPNLLEAPMRADLLAGLDFEKAVERRASLGGTARAAIAAQLESLAAWLTAARSGGPSGSPTRTP